MPSVLRAAPPVVGRCCGRPGVAAVLAGGFACGALCWAACSPPAPMAVGVSAPHASEPKIPDPLSAESAPDAGGSPVPHDFRSRWSRLGDRSLSRGHGEQFDGVVWANDRARALRARGADRDRERLDGGRRGLAGDASDDRLSEEGAIFLEEVLAHDPRGARSDTARGLLVMQKQASGWRYDAIDSSGRMAPPEALTRCAQCHQNGTDSLFFREEK